VIDVDDIDAAAEERARVAAVAACDGLLELLRQHHPEMKPAGPAGKAGTGLLRLRKVSTDNDQLNSALLHPQ
jgi:hypothetical protein